MDITMKCTAKRLTFPFVVYDTFFVFFKSKQITKMDNQ